MTSENVLPEDHDEIDWYTPKEVANKFRVDPKTVTRWAQVGRMDTYNIRTMRTPGGHRRFYKKDIDRMIEDLGGPVLSAPDVEPRGIE